MKVISTDNASVSDWGEGCKAWALVDLEIVSLKEEEMPAHTAERLHSHNYVHQIFYMLDGEAEFDIDNQRMKILRGGSIHILPRTRHRIINESDRTIRFLVYSQPAVKHDRFEY